MKTLKTALAFSALALSATALASPYTFEFKAKFTAQPNYPYVDVGSEFSGRFRNAGVTGGWVFEGENYNSKSDQSGSVDLWIPMGPGPFEGSVYSDDIGYYSAHTAVDQAGTLDVRGQTFIEGGYGSFSFSGALGPFARYIDRYDAKTNEVLMASLTPVQGTLAVYTGQLRWVYADITEVKVMMPIPEPSTYAMLLVGLACVGFRAKRLRR